MDHAHRSIRTRSVATEHYTRAIAVLCEQGDVTTGRLAAHLRVTPAAVTEMLQRLACHALVVYTPYHGVTLTQQGHQAAMSVLRRYRLLTVFLVQALDCPWDEVAAEADALAPVLSERLTARIAAYLGDPTTDVYGNPIPRLDGSIEDQPYRRLVDVHPGTHALVLRVPDRDPQLLRYFAEIGLVPAAEVHVVRREPFDGPTHLRLDGSRIEQAIGRDIAECISVSVETPTSAKLGITTDGEVYQG